MTDINLVNLRNVPILQQLQLEEALLRVDSENWCIINYGSPQAVVMGISAKPEKLLQRAVVEKMNIPVIKRFSGGGTVVVDPDTVFVTFICNENSLNVPSYPEPVMRWSDSFYRGVFSNTEFALRENDYVFGDRKFGGNAQYMRKGRWLHHTSFLWDFDCRSMECLKIPEKMPIYRQSRSHNGFLCKLRDQFPTKDLLRERIRKELLSTFDVQERSYEDVYDIPHKPHRKATCLVEI
ncbi:MAG: lipoate-protein ligase A [Chlamydiales bacterium]|jgi:lipoate-protein ligase A